MNSNMYSSNLQRPEQVSQLSDCLPPADLVVWEQLSECSMSTPLFQRDVIIGDHVICLASRSARVAVEFDLPSADQRSAEDAARVRALEDRSYAIVSIESFDVYTDLAGVMDRIVSAVLHTDRRRSSKRIAA